VHLTNKVRQRKEDDIKRIFAAISLVVLAVSCLAQTNHPKAEATDTNVIAIVLGKQITASEKDKLNGLIVGPLLERFAKVNHLEPTAEELDAFVLKAEEKEKQRRIKLQEDRATLIQELKNPALSSQERQQKESRLQRIVKWQDEIKQKGERMEEQIRTMYRQLAQRFVRAWKINQALYRKYGGRVIFQQAGAEPLDAYRAFLKEAEKKGSFQILEKQYVASFWRYYTNDAMHTFCSRDDGAKFINTPWWMIKEPPEK